MTWIVARTTEYEHGVEEFETEEEAKAAYEEHVRCVYKFEDERIYMAQVVQKLLK
jgi:hypothetical protein